MPQIALSALFLLGCLVVESLGDPLNSTTTTGKCTTSACVQVSNRILQMVNLSADPCEDFYQFSCGTYMANTEAYQTSITLSDEYLTSKVSKTVNRMLFQDRSSATSAQRKAIDYYNSCCDAANGDSLSNDDDSIAFLKNFLARELCGFSFVKEESDLDQSWVLESVLARNLLQNGTALFQMGVELNTRNSSWYSLVFEPETTPIFQHRSNVASISDDPTYLEEVKEAYVLYLKNLSQLILPTEVFENLREKYIRDLVDFELAIAKITPSPDEDNTASNDDVDNTNYTQTEENRFNVPVTDLEDISPNVNWTLFLLEIGKQYKIRELQTTRWGLKISYRGASYFSGLSQVINDTENKLGVKLARRTLHNYVTLKAAMSYMAQLSCGFTVPYENMRSKAMGKNAIAKEEVCQQNGTRQLYCQNEAVKVFPIILAREFLRTYFDEKTPANLLSMAEQIRKQFVKEFSSLNWMDADTKAKAILKVNTMLFSFGHPQDTFKSSFDSKYNLLEISKNYLSNVENVLHFNKVSELKRLDSRIDRIEETWRNSDTMVANAFYFPLANAFAFCAGTLVAPLYGPDFPAAFIWGQHGGVMGHEITHGFDNNGKNFDETGQYVNWWSNSSEISFQEKIDCVKKQFDEYVPEIEDYGDQVLGECIADNGGVKISFNAFKEAYGADFLQSIDLPGLPFTNEQVFFLARAQDYCYNYDDEGKNDLMPDEHAFPPFRVNGMMLNSEAWAKAFNCPVGSTMNPTNRERCDVW